MFRSKEQQKSFNFPYQCAADPRYGDDVYLANENEHVVEHGDILVMASDGVFDNLYDEQIKNCIRPQVRMGERLVDIQAAADCIGGQSTQYGQDSAWISPFAKGARAAGFYFLGGKLDDVTAVVSEISLR